MTQVQDYVGVRPKCGCTTTWIAGDEPPKRLAETVADWIRRGLSVERCSTEEARTRLKRCVCHKRRVE